MYFQTKTDLIAFTIFFCIIKGVNQKVSFFYQIFFKDYKRDNLCRNCSIELRNVWTCSEIRNVWICLNMFVHVWMCLNIFRYVWMLLDMLRYVRICSDMFAYVWVYLASIFSCSYIRNTYWNNTLSSYTMGLKQIPKGLPL